MFRRPGQRVTVLSRGENNEAPAQITHACVRPVSYTHLDVYKRQAYEGRLGFGERITRDWWTAMELDPASANGPRFEFSFRPDDPAAYPSASAICAFDFDRFAAALTAAGFRRETYRGEHGRVIHDTFERDALTVTVQTRGENDDSPDKIAHACVKTVLVD